MASNIAITGKKTKLDISYMSGECLDKFTGFPDEPVVQWDVPAVKNTSLVDDIANKF